MSFQASSPVYFNEGGTIKNSVGIIDKIELNERQKEIIDLIKKNKNISSREMSQELNINHSAVQKHLNKLKNAGIITRVGGTRGHWEINL
ncbi:MAG: winged helix-turn-helix transcriptional regulator [Bacteroidales bacterium]|nr:winged helix-turn-helix transcriptional regulator [Bacteroidales bacterium]